MNLEDMRDALYSVRDEGHEPLYIEVGPDIVLALARLAYQGPRQIGASRPRLVVTELWGYPVRERATQGYAIVVANKPKLLR